MTTRRKKLTPIPLRRASEAPTDRPPAVAGEPPRLDHIAEGLRGLACPLADIAFMVGNAVKHPPKQIEDLRASLRQFGQVEPLIVNRRANPPSVIGGNGRLQAMLAENWTHGAVLFVDLDPAKANALSIVLNRSSEARRWDAEALANLLLDVNTGCDEQLDAMLADLAKDKGLIPADDQAPPAPTTQTTTPRTCTCPSCGHEFIPALAQE